jgi:saccharopine dehydrogenase-like NADP-dependent oxidoreductase
VKECLDWLGMTGDAALQSVHLSAKDLFCQLLEEKLYYGENERDMILMHHAIGAKFGDGSTEEHYSSLQSFGDRSMSAMCKTVGYTAAAAADLVLNGTLEDRHGLLLPTEKKIYTPILENLKREGIVFEESHTVNMASQN